MGRSTTSPSRVATDGGRSRDVSWTERAACLDEDPDLFFPVGTTGPAVAQALRAKAVCARCPVASPCLQHAVTTGQRTGVWGGTTEDEREALRRRLARDRTED